MGKVEDAIARQEAALEELTYLVEGQGIVLTRLIQAVETMTGKPLPSADHEGGWTRAPSDKFV